MEKKRTPDDRRRAAMDRRHERAEANAQQIIDRLRLATLKRMMSMAASLPDGHYTEIKTQIMPDEGPPLTGTFKLRDFASCLKDIASIGGKNGAGTGNDIEDLGPIMSMIRGDDDEADDDDLDD